MKPKLHKIAPIQNVFVPFIICIYCLHITVITVANTESTKLGTLRVVLSTNHRTSYKYQNQQNPNKMPTTFTVTNHMSICISSINFVSFYCSDNVVEWKRNFLHFNCEICGCFAIPLHFGSHTKQTEVHCGLFNYFFHFCWVFWVCKQFSIFDTDSFQWLFCCLSMLAVCVFVFSGIFCVVSAVIQDAGFQRCNSNNHRVQSICGSPFQLHHVFVQCKWRILFSFLVCLEFCLHIFH